MANLEISINDTEIAGAFRPILSRVLNPQPILKRFAQYKLRIIDDGFRNEVSPDGTPFRKLSEKYLKRKAKNGGRSKTLQFKGFLRASIQVRGLTNDTLIIAPDTLQIPYAAAQQFGQPNRPDLAIPYLGFAEEDRLELEILTIEYLSGG